MHSHAGAWERGTVSVMYAFPRRSVGTRNGQRNVCIPTQERGNEEQHYFPVLLTEDIDMKFITRIVVFSVVLSAFSAKLLAENIQLHDMELTPADITFEGEMATWTHWTKSQCSRLPRDNIRTRKAGKRIAGIAEKRDKLVPYLTNKNPVNHPIIDYKDPEKIKIDPEKIFPPETLCM